MNMRFEVIVLMISVVNGWDLPTDLYHGAPPFVQIRGKASYEPTP
jgi:hypothetical protein